MVWDNVTTVGKARELIPGLSLEQKKTLQFAGGDYWGGGNDWAGMQVPQDAANRDAIMAELQRTFTPQPLLEEIVEGYLNGVVGNEPAFEFTLARPLGKKGDVVNGKTLDEDEQPTPEESELLGEVNSAIGAWFDKRKGHEVIETFAEYLVAAARGGIRSFVPWGLLDENGSVGAQDWKAALDSIFWEAPAPENAAVVVDKATMRPLSIYAYNHIARDAAGKENSVQRVEISFVNDAGQTVVRILEGDQVIENGEAEQDIGGELYYDEATLRKPLIGDAMHRQQRALNVINTVLLLNGDTAMLREKDYVNLRPPQRKVVDPSRPEGFRWEDDEVQTGSGVRNFWSGITYKDIDGNEKLATGSIVITDPVDPAPLIAAIDRFERNLYQAARQLHVKIDGDAVVSAISRVMARASFIERLKKLKPKIEGVLRSRLRGVALLACYLSSDAADKARLERIKTELRVNVECHINPGPLTPEERQAVIALYEAGIIPLEDAQIMLGIEDVDAVAQKLRAERDQSLSLLLDRAKIINELASAGAGIESAALLAGFSEEDAKKLAAGDFTLAGDGAGGAGAGGNDAGGGSNGSA